MLDYMKTWLALNGLALVRDKKGVTALEYGLIAALMAAVIVAAFTVLGNGLSGVMATVSKDLAGG